jgi:hypothetical protein
VLLECAVVARRGQNLLQHFCRLFEPSPNMLPENWIV